MKVWLTTDTHFNHKKILEYEYRPVDYEAKLAKGFDNYLKPEDLLIHLGDICIGNDEEVHLQYIKKIPCKKVLVRGNHDGKSNSWYLEHGWDFVCNKFQDKYFGKKILFSHVPKEDDGRFDINIHDHFHRRGAESHRVGEFKNILTPKHHLISVEELDYKPVLLETIIKQHNEREVERIRSIKSKPWYSFAKNIWGERI